MSPNAHDAAVSVSAFRCEEALRSPYVLSFATLERFETYYVLVEGGGRVGVGEITPLLGYSGESAETVEAALVRTLSGLEGGDAPSALVDSLADTDPFVASGLATALELWRSDGLSALTEPVEAPVPLVALCQGDTPEDLERSARDLAGAGYRCLKMKLRCAGVEDDMARIRAVAGQLPHGAELRLDANQGLRPDDAGRLCREIAAADLPAVILEQPFGPDDWVAHAALARESTVPLMLDESVRTEDDVAQARACGARFVKLKICKHKGLADTIRLGRQAADMGLGVVLGNGVQTALGNHLEARLHVAMGLGTAIEANGFLKLAAPVVRHRMSVSGGALTDAGLVAPVPDIRGKATPLWSHSAVAATDGVQPAADEPR